VRREGGIEGRRKRVKGASIGGAALWVERASGVRCDWDAGFLVRTRPVWSTAGTARWPILVCWRSVRKSAGECRRSVRSASSSTGATVMVGTALALRAGPGRRRSVRQMCECSPPRRVS
jgi:hypothetical protein